MRRESVAFPGPRAEHDDGMGRNLPLELADKM